MKGCVHESLSPCGCVLSTIQLSGFKSAFMAELAAALLGKRSQMISVLSECLVRSSVLG